MKGIATLGALGAQKIQIVYVVLIGIVLLAGCRAAPDQNSAYLQDPSEMKKVARSPFDRSWLDHKIDESNYTEILVRPVNMQYVKAQNIWESANVSSQINMQKDFDDIAAYAQQAFIEAVQTDPKHRFKIVDKAGPKTAVLELAIVQLIPAKVTLNAIGMAGPIASGAVMAVEVAGGVATNSQDSGQGVIAIEGRIRDGGTGKVIYMFADRERGQVAAVNIAEYTWWDGDKQIIDIWAHDLIELASTPANQKVQEPATFELLVW